MSVETHEDDSYTPWDTWDTNGSSYKSENEQCLEQKSFERTASLAAPESPLSSEGEDEEDGAKVKGGAIGQPINFKHVTHTAYSPQDGIKINVIDQELKEKFEPFVGGSGEDVLNSLMIKKDVKNAGSRGAPKKLTKADIGGPTNYVHVSHCGHDAVGMGMSDTKMSGDVSTDNEPQKNTNSSEMLNVGQNKESHIHTDGTVEQEDAEDCKPLTITGVEQNTAYRSVAKTRMNLPPPPPPPPPRSPPPPSLPPPLEEPHQDPVTDSFTIIQRSSAIQASEII